MLAAHVRQITRTHFDAICQTLSQDVQEVYRNVVTSAISNIDLKGKIPADH